MSNFMELSSCPKCGGAPGSTLEVVQGYAHLLRAGDGTYCYAGETDVDWDSQESVLTEDKRLTLKCGDCRHVYPDGPPKGCWTCKHDGGNNCQRMDFLVCSGSGGSELYEAIVKWVDDHVEDTWDLLTSQMPPGDGDYPACPGYEPEDPE